MARGRGRLTGESSLLKALFPGPRRFVLRSLFTEPNRWWSLEELAIQAAVQPSGLKRLIRPMRDGGLILEQPAGASSRFQPNPACPLYEQLCSILTGLAIDRQSGETILVVEDQPATAQITRILLESWGYQVLEARDAAEAIRIFDRHAPEIRLLLTDVIMPGKGGEQLAEELWRRDASLRVIFMSGYPGQRLTNGRVAFLAKPFNPAGLAKIVRRELGRAGAPIRSKMKQS